MGSREWWRCRGTFGTVAERTAGQGGKRGVQNRAELLMSSCIISLPFRSINSSSKLF